MTQFFAERGFTSLGFLYNNAVSAEGLVLAGSRGWFLDERQQTVIPADYGKLVNRECERLTISLRAAEEIRETEGIGAPPVVFLHFPPVYGDFRLDPLIDVLTSFGVKRCYAGHIHGQYGAPPYSDFRGIRFYNAAALFALWNESVAMLRIHNIVQVIVGSAVHAIVSENGSVQFVDRFAACLLVEPIYVLGYNSFEFAHLFQLRQRLMCVIRFRVSINQVVFVVVKEGLRISYEEAVRQHLFR
jgi:hypothetical protein